MSMLCEGDDIYTNVLCVPTLWRRKEQELLCAIISDEVRALGVSIIRTPESFHKSLVQCSKPAPALMHNLRLLTREDNASITLTDQSTLNGCTHADYNPN